MFVGRLRKKIGVDLIETVRGLGYRMQAPAMVIRSVTARVLLLATLWSAVALVVIAVVISALYAKSAERAFTDLLRAQLYNVINSITIGDDNSLQGNPQLGDLRFSQPETGWYGSSSRSAPCGHAAVLLLARVSNIAVPSILNVLSTTGTRGFYPAYDAFGNHVLVAETEVVLDSDGRAARFRVSGNLTVVDSDIEGFTRNLYIALVVFGVLSPCRQWSCHSLWSQTACRCPRALERVRRGEVERLEGEFPREVQSLTVEMNALIGQQPAHCRAGAHAGRQSCPFAEDPDRGASERGAPARQAAGGGGEEPVRGDAGSGTVLPQSRPALPPARITSGADRSRAASWNG